MFSVVTISSLLAEKVPPSLYSLEALSFKDFEDEDAGFAFIITLRDFSVKPEPYQMSLSYPSALI